MNKITTGVVILILGATACTSDTIPQDNIALQHSELPTQKIIETTSPIVRPRKPPRVSRNSPPRVNPQRVRKSSPTAIQPKPGWNEIKERIADCESGGRYNARNKRSTASGKYQFLDSTWAERYGHKRAYQASPEQQEQAAAELHASSGLRPWKSSQNCWNDKGK